ncbi:cation:proton antiporter [Coleofasciculus sp. LEGE 07081]|uniref:cation:proton antiporter n=1 Tax=unclassified Coleofasciculus TaxID=2692782 RepID=UPI001882CD27|nr:cation:proton antiporter [Coleofasciculus sp. LEGE 07081]MBE9150109.1 cation:proton antiporter [Coleofasciculus sp. LEGE 07092]
MQWLGDHTVLAIPTVVGEEGKSSVSEIVIVLIVLLLVATGVALLSRRLRIPYIAGLVLAGLAITDTELLPGRIDLDSSLIFNLFLPILLFEAAINTDVSRLRSTIKPIALLAGPGVVLCAGITSVLLKVELGLEWIPALLVGVILSITDTALVIAVFKEVSVPHRLITLVEGESLLIDDVALVLFSLILTVYSTGSLSVLDVIREFLFVILGGVLVGLALGYLSVGLFRQTDDALGGILLTVAVALGAFQVGQFLEVSGVVAVVAAGLIVGNLGLAKSTSASTQVTLSSFWEFAAFGVNTFIFLLIGLEINLITLWETLPSIFLALIAYQAGRAFTVYPLLALVGFVDRPIPVRWRHVLFVGNIKGSLSTALALSLPASLPQRETLIAIALGIVVVSLVGQGLSLPWILRRLQLSHQSEYRQQIEELQAQLMTAKAAQDELDNLLKTGVLPKSIYEEMRAAYQVRVAASDRTLREIYNQRSENSPLLSVGRTKLDAIRRQLLLAEKGALNEALRRNILSEEIVQERIQRLNEQLLNLEDD